jgi:hypothetical protein
MMILSTHRISSNPWEITPPILLNFGRDGLYGHLLIQGAEGVIQHNQWHVPSLHEDHQGLGIGTSDFETHTYIHIIYIYIYRDIHTSDYIYR